MTFLAAVAAADGRATGSVRITNRRDSAVALGFPDDCLTLVRIYPIEPAGTPPIWEERASRACAPGPVRLEIPAHGVLEVRVPPIDLAAIAPLAADSLPAAASYRTTVTLRPDGRVVEIEAGTLALR